MAKRNLLVYLTWETLIQWKKERKPGRNINEDAPYAYGSDQIRLYKLARPGDVLWVICSPRFGPYRLPPSLIARLVVSKVVDQEDPKINERTIFKIPKASEKWQYVALANREKSRYYSLNNAYQALTSLTFISDKSKLDPETCAHCQKLIESGGELYAGLPSHLQTIREIAPEAEPIMQEFAAQVAQGRIIFLSYRRSEAGEVAKDMVRELNKGSVYCWLDNLVMPQRVAKGYKLVDDDVLVSALRDGVRQSTMFVALLTPTYHSSRWTRLEWGEAVGEMANPRRARPLQLIMAKLGGKPPTPEPAVEIVVGDNGQQIADQVLNYLGP